MYEVEVWELRYTERLTLLFDDNIVQIDIFGLLPSQIGKGGYSVFLSFDFSVIPWDDNILIEKLEGGLVADQSPCPYDIDVGWIFFLAWGESDE